jgi:hypothetical protein
VIDNVSLGDASCPSLSLCPTRLPLHAHFDGTQLTSDGGLCWLSVANTALGLCALLAAVNRGKENRNVAAR